VKHVRSKTERDIALIMAIVRRFGPISRVGIHELTHLRPATISDIVRGLLDEGKISEAGASTNPLGRKQVLLELREDFGFVVAIEFDPDFVVASALSLKPKPLSVIKERTCTDGGQEGLLRQLISCARRAMEEAGLRDRRPLGIGFADAGLIDSQKGVALMSSEIEFWRNIPLKEIFEREFQAPFLLESNTRCRAVAERAAGAGQMAGNMIFIDYRAGIGAGVFSDGRILRGRHDSAGELGHTHIVRDGPPCKCGSFGCLDAMIGAAALGARARKALEQGGVSRALSIAGSVSNVSGWTVLQAAGEGDKMCSSLVEDVGDHLGLAIANLVNLFSPEVVVLSSGLKLAGRQLLDQIIRIVKIQALPYLTDGITFRYGELGDEGGVLGAGLIVVENLFEVPALKPPKYMVDESESSSFEDLPEKGSLKETAASL
jgi:glucokinase